MDPDDPRDADVRQWRRRLRAGDRDAFTALFQAHVDRVHRVAAGLCGDGHLAEDVTAETFLTAWKNRATIADSDDDLGPWLSAIAARQALNATRSRRRLTRFVARHGHRFEDRAPDFADVVAARLDDADAVARTRAALDRLDPREVEVLVVCVWSATSTREAAAALGVAEGTVRSRLSRARRKLRELAAPPAPDPGARAARPVTSHPVRPTP